ncbi:MAG: hypothetical protein LBQ12_01865 [Deltaproteobacteria bacterium]|nr:hypothetical protein [Deltaproteobacteria bacterium]
MPDQNAAAVEGAAGVGTSGLTGALEKALDAATDGEMDIIRRKLGIASPEAPSA